MLRLASSRSMLRGGVSAALKGPVGASPLGLSRALLSTRGKYFAPVEVKDGIAIIRIDGPGKMNTIDDHFRQEIDALWTEKVANDPNVKAAVLISAKPDNFIAGADIKFIDSVDDFSTLKDVCLKGHSTFQKIRAAGKPLVAAINGPALGGGLEVALYCDYRIVTSSPKTVLGLPEVKLGLLPGFGGTQNLRPIVGLQAALDMTLTGKNIRPDKAKKMGLADIVVDPAALEAVALDTAKALAAGSLKVKRKSKGIVQRVLEDTSVGRSIVFGQTEKMVAKNTGGHYPSPTAILDTVKYGLSHSKPQALEYEATRFAELAATSVSAALRGIFTGTTALKQSKYGKPAHSIGTVAVVGAGLMGAGIAQVTAEKGYRVLLKDKDLAGVSRGEKYISDNLKGKMKKKRMTKYAYDSTTSRVVGLTDDSPQWGKQFEKADMVIEAVFENLDLKHAVIKQVEEHLPEHAVFASNTSAIPISRIAEASKRPENVIGMHYFSPVPQMPLLEIIPHKGTSDKAAAAAFEVGKKQGKTVIFVKDVPGFYVNRCLGPYLVETGALIEAGVPLEQLDSAMKEYGFPVGPITLADEVGVDVAAHVQSFLSKADLGVRMGGSDGPVLDALMKAKMLGRKTGKGFYTYPAAGGKKEKGPRTLNPEAVGLIKKFIKGESKLSKEEVQNRLVSRFVNEAVFALQDGVIASPVEGDIGAVFGIGFPPFLGGPFRLLDSVGVGKYCAMLEGFAAKYGEQFAPAPLLVEYAKSEKKFHKS